MQNNCQKSSLKNNFIYNLRLDCFLDFAFSNANINGKISCPCARCKIGICVSREDVYDHLTVDGFIKGYTHSVAHGEITCLEIGGEMNLTVGIQVAQLALKHRQNKKQQQRIIVFAGSPVKYDKKLLELIGRKLKKNSVSLDIIHFGEEDGEKAEKLEALLSAVNNNDSSHIVHVPPGPSALSDVLISTHIFTGDGEGGSGFAAAAAAGGVSGFDFGVDPNLDPELALALRVSMEEERARQEAAAKKAIEEAEKQDVGEQQSNSQDLTMAETVNP